jgi:quercetin dioxygenase-like cupin family protein
MLGSVSGAMQTQLIVQQATGTIPREEYKSTAKMAQLLRDDLTTIAGKEATVQAVELAPGWVGEKHFHTGDVFVYVQEGRFVVDVSGEGEKVFEPGQVYHEAINTVMQARNGAGGTPTRLLLFQVGSKGEPLMLKAQ